ncbi:Surface polysaccharide O-acyltransferase, integral membrane enzyme [Lentibacillus persicus]|uniref:Surface polysaccharide O-acyltransferase, integral membrane enzyme n=1 Tax=Lentibacillus persicus TaxID=640948 RepID=A0A1I1XU33_9BACI|nr:acyltransferase [Lentibacillus persicus]SFE10751.1 Surface polysaccharide O-acyltransferase, integral membrane enzyme [Lentibacillus persicus]
MERNYSIDFVKFFAIFAVVCIHTGTLKDVQGTVVDGATIDFIIDTAARFAVPFFFAASGFLFYQKLLTLHGVKAQWRYANKYIIKLIKLWAAWFAFYFCFDLVINFIETEKSRTALLAMYHDYIESFLSLETFYYGAGHSQYHLWFLLALIWSVIALFIFSKARLVRVLVVIGLGLNIYGLTGQSYSFVLDLPFSTRDALFFGGFYTGLGGLFARYSDRLKHAANDIPDLHYVVLFVMLTLMQLLEGYVTIKLFGGNTGEYYLTTIPLISILFMFIMKHNSIGKGTRLSQIGSRAVGIYVSHVFIMETIEVVITRIDIVSVQDTLIWNIMFTPLVFVASYLFYGRLQHIKKYGAAAIQSRGAPFVYPKNNF